MASQLTAAIAHDVNQPLMAISANAGAALRRLRCDPPRLDLLEALLHDIVAQSQRAGRTVSAWQACARQCPDASADALQAAVHAATDAGASP
ncbi:histidine kinase dimerization/phospho-acceptor domain-containing protein [Massilia sp. BKSP1R2A-1]|uniref:histidine kinase dimerization/phospho-acceptor domain-containing protein n=1 Tax=Massilia sp. BKSP1R2A-1 TaxID=3422595 RepID=UPI003D3456F0